jgi:Flp pilus assembly protein TadG
MRAGRHLAACWKNSAGVFRDVQATQLVEFAVSLPLLVVFVVGIFDFSNAFTLKQRLTNIARDAARASAYDPGSDLQSSIPISVSDAYQIVYNYLYASGLNTCGMTSTQTATNPQPLTWLFSGNGNGCPAAGLQITVNRGYYLAATATNAAPSTCIPQGTGGQVALISTCVSIQYPYSWRFGNVASLLGTTAILPTQINAVAVSMNEN